MKRSELQVDIHPVPAPQKAVSLYETEELKEINFVCKRLLSTYNREQDYDEEAILQHFELLQSVMSLTQHIEIITKDRLDWERLLKKLGGILPQFVWIKGSHLKNPHQQVYYFDFIPLAYRQQGFPVEINLATSLQQQLFFPEEWSTEALVSEITTIIVNDELLLTDENQPLAVSSESSEYNGLPEEFSKEGLEDQQLRLENQKLTKQLERLQYTLMSEGLSHFEVGLQESETDFEEWDRPLRISLREYRQLMQKAKSLERVWRLNDEMVRKTEKMIVTDTQFVYEREQVKQIKETISFSDIFLVLDECEEIEERVKVKYRPWFRKPYVKMIKMDYDSLVDKAAYFDILQAESFVLEELSKEQTAQEIKEVNELNERFFAKEKEDVRETVNN